MAQPPNDPRRIKRRVAELEIEMGKLEKQIDSARRQRTIALLGILIGLVLTPFGIGIILIIAGILAFLTQTPRARNKVRQLETLEQEMIRLRAEL